MMEIRAKTFANINDAGTGAVYEDIVLDRCTFRGCAFSAGRDIATRSTARRVVARNCTVERVVVGPAVFDEVQIDGLRTVGLLQLWAPAFRRTVIRGRVGRVMTSPLVDPLASQATIHAFLSANAEFYQTVDWALDIADAEFEEVDLGGVPADLVRRDPATQVVVTRQRAQEGLWRRESLPGLLRVALERLANGTTDSEVIVAPKRHERFGELLTGVEHLVRLGIATA